MGEHYSKKELGKDMYQFFIEDENAAEDFVTIEGSDVNHIKNVLRMKPGEKIRVCTRNGQNYFAVYLILQKALFVRIFWKRGGKHRTAMQDLSVSGASEE